MDDLYIIVGLGNPGRKYSGTRHNIGFEVIDELADAYQFSGPEHFGKSMIGRGRIGGRRVILVKPMTYMNLSGEAVREIVDFYKADPEDHLLVISDVIDLEVGTIRIRARGSAGGHNGLKNIVQHLGGGAFPRIRVGVGEKPGRGGDLISHVLGHFSADDREAMDLAVKKAAEACAIFVTDGIDLAMNRCNTPRKKKEKKPPKAAAETAAEEAAQAAGTGASDTAGTGPLEAPSSGEEAPSGTGSRI